MKTIIVALAAVTLFAANASAADDFAQKFFQDQSRYGENTVSSDLIGSGQIVHPLGILGAK